MSTIDRGALASLITYLGLSHREAADFLGMGHETLSRKLAGKERYDVRPEEIAALEALAATTDKMTDKAVSIVHKMIAAHGLPTEDIVPPVRLLIYRSDDDLPPWAGLPFASAHRATAARTVRRINAIEPGRRLATTVLFDRVDYQHTLAGAADTQESRTRWASRQGHRLAVEMGPAEPGNMAIGWAVIQEPPATADLGSGVERID